MIYLTGAAGFLGTALAKQLDLEGEAVEGCDLLHSTRWQRADVADYRQLSAVVPAETTTLVHLAAEFGRFNGDDYPEQLWRTNALGTRNVLNLARHRGFRVILASSSEVYGTAAHMADGAPLQEDGGAHLGVPLNDYALSKLAAERMAMIDHHRHGTEVMVVRPFNAYGPGEPFSGYRSVVSQFVHRLLLDLPVVCYGDTVRDFLYIDDAARLLSRCIESFRAGETLNIGSPCRASMAELLELVQDAVGNSASEVSRWKTETWNTQIKVPDLTKMRAVLGITEYWTWTQLRDGIARTVDWARRQNLSPRLGSDPLIERESRRPSESASPATS